LPAQTKLMSPGYKSDKSGFSVIIKNSLCCCIRLQPNPSKDYAFELLLDPIERITELIDVIEVVLTRTEKTINAPPQEIIFHTHKKIQVYQPIQPEPRLRKYQSRSQLHPSGNYSQPGYETQLTLISGTENYNALCREIDFLFR